MVEDHTFEGFSIARAAERDQHRSPFFHGMDGGMIDRRKESEARLEAFGESLAKPWTIDSTDYYLNNFSSLACKARSKHNV